MAKSTVVSQKVVIFWCISDYLIYCLTLLLTTANSKQWRWHLWLLVLWYLVAHEIPIFWEAVSVSGQEKDKGEWL